MLLAFTQAQSTKSKVQSSSTSIIHNLCKTISFQTRTANERAININQISSEVQKRFKNTKSVYVMADKATVYDPIAQVISTLDEAHLGVKLVTKPQELPGGR